MKFDWLCIKDNEVVNIVNAEESFMQTDDVIQNDYDSYEKKDDCGYPEIKIGSYKENGVWKNTLSLLHVNADFSNQDLTNQSFKDCDLSGANFVGATITGCDFCGVRGSFSLVGAIWDGETILYGPVWINNPYYFCMLTDAFTVMGCVTMPTRDVAGMSPEEVSSSDTSNPSKPAQFWLAIKDQFLALLTSWGM